MIERTLFGGKVNAVFAGWKLIPNIKNVPTSPQEINYNIPASSRPSPIPWKSKRMEPDRVYKAILLQNKEYKVLVSDGSESEIDPFGKIEL